MTTCCPAVHKSLMRETDPTKPFPQTLDAAKLVENGVLEFARHSPRSVQTPDGVIEIPENVAVAVHGKGLYADFGGSPKLGRLICKKERVWYFEDEEAPTWISDGDLQPT